MVQHPEVLWAQRSSDSDAEKNIIYLTINLPDIKVSSLEYNLTATTIHFKANAGADEKEYAFDLELYSEVDVEKSKKNLSTRSLSLTILKKDLKSDYWPRLTKEKVKNAFLKTDFSKWVDEDEQDGEAPAVEEPGPDMGMGGMGGMGGGMDFEKMMSQMGGMGGMGGMEGLGGMGGIEGLGGLGGMGGLGGLGGSSSTGTAGDTGDLADDDSDDDGPPPLEDAVPAK